MTALIPIVILAAYVIAAIVWFGLAWKAANARIDTDLATMNRTPMPDNTNATDGLQVIIAKTSAELPDMSTRFIVRVGHTTDGTLTAGIIKPSPVCQPCTGKILTKVADELAAHDHVTLAEIAQALVNEEVPESRVFAQIVAAATTDGVATFDPADLAQRADYPPDQIETLLAHLVQNGFLRRLPNESDLHRYQLTTPPRFRL